MARLSIALVSCSADLAHVAWSSLRRLGPVGVVMLGPRRVLARASRMHVQELESPGRVDDGTLRAATAGADLVFPCDERSHVRLLDAGIPVLGHPDGDLVRRLADKGALPDLAREAGFCTPPLLDGPWMDGFGGGRYLEKPRFGGGGVGVHEWRRGDTRHPESVLQPFVEGQDADVSVVALEGRVLGITAEQEVGPGMRWYSERPVLEEMVRALVERTGYSGLLHVDLRVDAEGLPWVVDVNPRIWASHWMAAALGMDFAAAFVRAATGRPRRWRRRTGVVAPPWRFRDARYWGKPRIVASARAGLARAADLGLLRARLRPSAEPRDSVEAWPQAF